MKKIAVFGKPGSGKSTFSKQLAAQIGIKLYAMDSILYQADGKEIDLEAYTNIHEEVLSADSWLIEGFAPFTALGSFYRRIEEADTLIYIDLPYFVSYWLVTKRLLKGLFKKPEGWPQGASIVKGSLSSYKTLRLCPKFWNRAFLRKLEAQSSNKKLYVIRSLAQLNRFIETQKP
jgi:adenylate kinase family enzyme